MTYNIELVSFDEDKLRAVWELIAESLIVERSEMHLIFKNIKHMRVLKTLSLVAWQLFS